MNNTRNGAKEKKVMENKEIRFFTAFSRTQYLKTIVRSLFFNGSTFCFVWTLIDIPIVI